jgi:hypothetical protein
MPRYHSVSSARRLLAAGQSPEPGQVADPAFSLKSFATQPIATG